MPSLLSLVVGFLVMLPFGGLCLWASYRLGRRFRITNQVAALVLGLGVFPLPFIIMFMAIISLVFHQLHLLHDGIYAFSGIGVSGWIGMGTALIANLKVENLKQKAAKSSDARHL